MVIKDILELRLTNQHLTKPILSNPADIVKWFGAMQSQDFASAKWALGQRVTNATDATIEDAFTKGEILRTHVMRPTWHFVHPEDIRWMLKLTAPRVKAVMRYYYRQLELDEQLIKKTQAIFTNVLKGKKQLTRIQLSESLQREGIAATGQKLGHIVGEAELDGVICSGPRIGKQFTYMLLEERVPQVTEKTRDEALQELTKRYFQSHGPATVKDFSWWSGVSMSDARKGIALQTALENETIEEKTYYFFRTKQLPMKDMIYLLPNYDEYTIAYKERELFFDPKEAKKLPPVGRAVAFSHTMVRNGRIIGMYKKEVIKNKLVITPQFFVPPTHEEKMVLQKSRERYQLFLGSQE